MDTTNEPVAWRWKYVKENGEPFTDWQYWHEEPTILNKDKKYLEPLYTHPHSGVKAKILADAETALKSLYDAVIRYENLSPFPDKYAIESCEYQLHDAKEKARAILRKAQGD
jgi:hypothetical protein